MEVKERVSALRDLMEREGIDAYIVPSTDQHNSEYLPECWKRRQWISGFTGSAGDVAVTKDKAGLWTDGRYFLQAEEQLQDTGIVLFKMGMEGVKKLEDWLARELSKGCKVGIDPRVISVDMSSKLSKTLKEREIELEYVQTNLVDELWKNRPQPSKNPIKVMDTEFTGASVNEKLEKVRAKLKEELCGAHVLSSLDTIAWTFNIRGTDIEFNPLVISYAVILDDSAHLFIDPKKVTQEVKAHLSGSATLHKYNDIGPFLGELGKKNIKVWIDPKTTNRWIMLSLGKGVRTHLERSPVTDMKSVKNEKEIQGFKDCLTVDGAAMVKFFRWLKEAVPRGGVTEIEAADKLEQFRKQGKNFVGLSFSTISGYGEHGAIIHYDPTPETDVELKPEGIYLVDSGGQYQNGTTDITRTIALGEPTPEQKEMFTRVLKGHIDLARLRFPKGFSGKQIDAFARRALWDTGKNYNHGTGHGIGHYLNVHEGPMGITPRDVGVPLQAGNVLSNEPGYYKPCEYGIRTENLILTLKDLEFSTEEQEFLRFETMTLCPIDLNLVEASLLGQEERKWLNDYHTEVFEKLSPLLDDEHKEWLKENTGEI
ncbi:MAG: aminopeptidase P family protein [Thermoplasmatota archaeon]